jgi:hypothetical protein
MTVHDIASFVGKEESLEATFDTTTIEVTLGSQPDIAVVGVVAPGEPEIVEVEVPGIQGPPGLDNYVISETQPENPTEEMIWFRITS